MPKFDVKPVAILVVTAGVALGSIAPANAETLGKWNYDSPASFCSIGTKQNGAMLLMVTSSSGANGMMVIPADQNSITVGSEYKIKLSIAGHDLPEKTVNSGLFGGHKVLHIAIKAAKIAADMPDGFPFRVVMNDKVVFDMDGSASHEAFAAYVACSKKFGA